MLPSSLLLRQLRHQLLGPLQSSAGLSALGQQTRARLASAPGTDHSLSMALSWLKHTQQLVLKIVHMKGWATVLQSCIAKLPMRQQLQMQSSLSQVSRPNPVLQTCLHEETLMQMILPPLACTNPLYPLQLLATSPGIILLITTVKAWARVPKQTAARWCCTWGTMTKPREVQVHTGIHRPIMQPHSKRRKTCNMSSGVLLTLCGTAHCSVHIVKDHGQHSHGTVALVTSIDVTCSNAPFWHSSMGAIV